MISVFLLKLKNISLSYIKVQICIKLVFKMFIFKLNTSMMTVHKMILNNFEQNINNKNLNVNSINLMEIKIDLSYI